MALFQVILTAEYFQQRIVNTFTYESTDTPAGVSLSFALFNAFTGPQGVTSVVRTLQVNTYEYTQIDVNNLYDLDDFWSSPLNIVGNNAGVGVTPAIAAGLRTNRVSRSIRRGTKRFAGLVQSGVSAGGELAAGTLTVMDSIATRMAETLTYDDSGNTLSFTPVILGREKYTTPSGNTAYRFYPTLAEQEQNKVSGFLWEPYTTVRTQTSRQYGNGS